MSAGGDSQGHEARFERELARDRALLAFFNHATLAASLVIVATLLVLVFPMGRISPWLVGLTFYSAATRLGVFVARHALRLPMFLVELDSDDAFVRASARAVFERNREELGRALLTHGNERPTAEQVRALDPGEAAALARGFDLAGRRRAGLVFAVVWIAVSLAIWTTIFLTGGGPTSLTGSR